MTGAARTVARAALLVAGLTVLARVTGFGRVLVFARTVGNTCLGDTYQTVNTVPNVVYEVVAGGALAGVVVPLLAGAVGGADRERVSRTSSALLTWAVVVLTPVAVVVAVLAEPIARLLLGGKDCVGAVDVGAGMLRVFAPQIVLYGVGIVLTGVLQAHERFAGPALAPLVSSVVVIAAYLLFAAVTARGVAADAVSTREQLVLSLGTTLGVVALTATLLPPLARTGVRLQPTLAFPPGAAARVRGLAGAGAAALAGQQAAVAATLWLGNNAGAPEATLVTVTYAQAVFLLPWGVLAVPVATGAFPLLSARADSGDDEGFATALAGSTRAVLLVSAVGAATLVAAARPVARVVVEGAPGVATVGVLTGGLVAFAPGLLGYGLYALHTRALYARGRTRAAASATAAGWLVAVAAAAGFAAVLPDADRVVALGLGNALGMCALGVLLARAVAGAAGPRALAGVARTTLASVAGAGAGAGAGALLVRLLPDGGLPGAVAQALAAALVAAAVVVLVTARVAGDDLRALRRAGLVRRGAVTS